MTKKRAKDEGTLTYDEGRGVWVGRLPRSVDPKRQAVYGRTQREARDKMKRARRNAERGLSAASENLRLGEYLEETWIGVVRARVEAGKLAPRTAEGYERQVRLRLVPMLGHVQLRKLTPGVVEDALGKLQAQGLAPWTIRATRTALSRALRDAVRDGLVDRNVARLVDPPPLEQRHPSAFTVEEFGRIAKACADDRLGRFFLFVAFTGARRSEALGLEWRDVDLDDETWQVRETLHHVPKAAERATGRTGLVHGAPKTEASGDPVPLSRQAVALLREHHRAQTAERLRFPEPWPYEPEETPVFASKVGTPLHPSNVSRAWPKLLERADVPREAPDGRPRGLHELRRTFATRLRDAGIPLEDVQRLGRWTSSETLLRLYAGSDAQRLRRAADAVGDALSK